MRVTQIRVLGGAMSRVPVDATAFAHQADKTSASDLRSASGCGLPNVHLRSRILRRLTQVSESAACFARASSRLSGRLAIVSALASRSAGEFGTSASVPPPSTERRQMAGPGSV
jgi:hypothetical protein